MTTYTTTPDTAHASSVWIAGTFDTKAAELHYIADCMRAQGLACLTVDVSTSSLEPRGTDISALEVARHHPQGSQAVATGERGSAVTAMALALQNCVLARQSEVSGLLGAGGSGAAALLSPALQALPVGLPKVMVTTMAAGDVKPYVGASDIFMLYPVTDVSGINSISAVVLANAAHAMAGMLRFRQPAPPRTKPAIGLSMFGVTTPCVQAVTQALGEDFDCIVFHATGAGGQAMEKLAASGMLRAVLDITTTEMADELVGGVLSAGPQRLDAIAQAGVPYVGSVGALDVVNFWAKDSVPEKFQNRTLHMHNSHVTLMRTNTQESAEIGRWLAHKIQRMSGPTRLLIPAGGFSALDAPGQPFYAPEANAALMDAVQDVLSPQQQRLVQVLPFHINSPEFAAALVAALHEVLHESTQNQAISE
jgi:uncharacterized protein (UPF0261 family)